LSQLAEKMVQTDDEEETVSQNSKRIIKRPRMGFTDDEDEQVSL